MVIGYALCAGCSYHFDVTARAAGTGAVVGPNGEMLDQDGDTISNADEGAATGVNTDGDGYPDYLDLDSDKDGIPDATEAGDNDLATPPIDSDGDGTPDYRDQDSDGDTIADSDELDAKFAVVDSDGDGTPDYRDQDSDGDTIADADERWFDPDGDGTPNFRDQDSEGDGIPDSIEAGDKDLSTPPVDTDGDTIPDFLDLDSDGDFVPDSKEDKNGNGVVDPGESSPTKADTDGDGVPDLIEIIAGSDPNDPSKTIPPGDFYFVLPYQGPGKDGQLDFSTSVKQADIFFSMDTTGSFGEEIAAVQAALDKLIVPGVGKIIPKAAFGVGRFEDMPLAPWGLPGNKPYQLLQPITTDLKLVAAGLSALAPAKGGLDVAESGMEALYQWASGAGLPELGYAPFAPKGGIGGVGFRNNSLPIIVQIGDAISHKASEYSSKIPSAHSRDQTVAVLHAIGARVIGIDSLENQGLPADPRAEFEDLAIATKALVPPDKMDSKCHTGVGGALHDPVTVNAQKLCPVVYDVLPDGSGLGASIVDAIGELAQHAVLDISTATVGVKKGVNGEDVTAGHTTADFIKAVTPVPPVPAGASIQGKQFSNVKPGSTVNFKVDAFNDFQPPLGFDQIFQAGIHVLGDLVTLLDVRKVYIVVPRLILQPN